MDDKLNITEKLQKIVKQRKTQIITSERESSYKYSRSNFSSSSIEGYFNTSNDE